MKSLLLGTHSPARGRIRRVPPPAGASRRVGGRGEGERGGMGGAAPVHHGEIEEVEAEAEQRSMADGAGSTPVAAAPRVVVAAFDATRKYTEDEIGGALEQVRMHGDVLRDGDALTVLVVLHEVTNPMGYQSKVCKTCFGGTCSRYLEQEASTKADLYDAMLRRSADELRKSGVSLTLKVIAASPARMVVLREITSSQAAWVILDRHLRKEFLFSAKFIPCKVATFQESSFSVRVLKSLNTTAPPQLLGKCTADGKALYSVIRKFELEPDTPTPEEESIAFALTPESVISSDPTTPTAEEEVINSSPVMLSAASYYASLGAGASPTSEGSPFVL